MRCTALLPSLWVSVPYVFVCCLCFAHTRTLVVTPCAAAPVTLAEWKDYYADIGAGIPSDDYFVAMIESVWLISEGELSAADEAKIEGWAGQCRVSAAVSACACAALVCVSLCAALVIFACLF